MKTTIYRIENEDGHGPYHRRGIALGVDGSSTPARPGPIRDHIGRMPNEPRFGYASIEQLTRWWNDDLLGFQALRDNGWFLAVYEAETVAHGGTQVVFSANGSRRVNRVPLAEAFTPYLTLTLPSTLLERAA